MILDRLSNADTYANASGELAIAFEFLRQGDFEDFSTGRHEVHGERMYMMLNRYTTRQSAEIPFETHRAYVDVHYIVSGRETLFWEDLNSMPLGEGYDSDGDAELFRYSGGLPITLEPGMFVVLYPWDAHKPGCTSGPAVSICKVVLKIKL